MHGVVCCLGIVQDSVRSFRPREFWNFLAGQVLRAASCTGPAHSGRCSSSFNLDLSTSTASERLIEVNGFKF